jgi:hypothetical protein
MIRALLAGGVLLCAGAPVLANDLVEQHLAALHADFDAPVAAALDAIDGTGRRLLAARSYLRSAAHLAERWSWTEAQIEAYAGSPEQVRLDAAIARVRCEFEVANPGYTLFVNPVIRSLDVQIEHWNHNDSVTRAAEGMLGDVSAAVAAAKFPKAGTPVGKAAFQRLLAGHEPQPKPTIAAPGLSLHGRMQAVDFQVKAGERIVAGPEVASIDESWEATRWKLNLQAAVESADVGFRGPLQDPYEPWHYDFQPEPDRAFAVVACGR